jgi:hypothetical protein
VFGKLRLDEQIAGGTTGPENVLLEALIHLVRERHASSSTYRSPANSLPAGDHAFSGIVALRYFQST